MCRQIQGIRHYIPVIYRTDRNQVKGRIEDRHSNKPLKYFRGPDRNMRLSVIKAYHVYHNQKTRRRCLNQYQHFTYSFL